MRALLALLLAALMLASTAKRLFRRPRPNLVFQFKDIYSCPDYDQNETIALHYSETGDVYADSEWTVVNPAKRLSKLVQIMTSCREDGTACEHFMTWNSPMDGCSFIAAKHAVWTPAFTNIRPPFVCPLAATHYVNKNWTIDKELLKSLPFPRNRLYKDRLEMWNEKNELTYCFILEMIWRDFKRKTSGGSGPGAGTATESSGGTDNSTALAADDAEGSANATVHDKEE